MRQMPIVEHSKGRTIKQKQKFVEAIAKEAEKILNVRMEWVTVLFDEYERENWASEGQLHLLKDGEGFGKQGTE